MRNSKLARTLGAAMLGLGLLSSPAFAEDGFLYSGAFYDDRYSDTTFAIDATQPFGRSGAGLRPYLDANLNLDSQTLNVDIPETLTDNYALGALGLQFTNVAGFRAFAQIGVTARVGAVAAHEPGADFRGGAELSRSWRGLGTRRARYGNYYGSATYISRYRDAVLLNAVEEGRTFRYGTHAVDICLRALLSFGSHGFYYTNYAEGTVGLRFHSPAVSRVTLSVEESTGLYLLRTSRPATQSDAYHDFRINLGYGLPF